MNVRLTQGLVGENSSFLPRQIVECSDETGERLIRGRIGVRAKDDAEVDAIYPEPTPEERKAAEAKARVKYAKMGLNPDKILAKRRGVERAIKPTPETPEGGDPATDDQGKCQGETGAGNPCGRKAVKGKKYCAAHQE
jgi:hypothetical protein